MCSRAHRGMNSPVDSKQRASNHHAANVKDDCFEWHHVYVVAAAQREWKERWLFLADSRSCCGGFLNVVSCKVVDPDDGQAGSMQACKHPAEGPGGERG